MLDRIHQNWDFDFVWQGLVAESQLQRLGQDLRRRFKIRIVGISCYRVESSRVHRGKLELAQLELISWVHLTP